MKTEIEARAYGPDASEAEREAIRSRVEVVEEGILRIQELPVQSPFSVDVIFDRVAELAADCQRFFVIVDLRGAGRPDAATRARLRERIESLLPRLAHLSVFFESNVVLRTAAKFIVRPVFSSVSVHRTEDEAMRAIRDVR